MGTLRTEPKKKEFISDELYQHYLDVLRKAKSCIEDHFVYYDLDAEEDATKVKKAFHFVADKENMDVTVSLLRGKRTLSFKFKKGASSGARMPAEECRQRILKCLEQAPAPLKKNEIIKKTLVSSSTWNIRIRELVEAGCVARHGDRRDTTYSFVKHSN